MRPKDQTRPDFQTLDLLDDDGPMIWVKTLIDEILNLPDIWDNVGDVCRWHPHLVAAKYKDIDYHIGWIDGEVVVSISWPKCVNSFILLFQNYLYLHSKGA